ncbi:hypothetical protein [Clostridium ganghwense]|uniref:Uncharacterized protein n=1 Tax=Clostridium ganghwense TaxID=312089 RepID=A0ABT4CX84_9CLOT|nr:hypothetical protein [Clostridium ganghwense]MCY6372791.1 hypothetical protein [Clostridium ganghwense]
MSKLPLIADIGEVRTKTKTVSIDDMISGAGDIGYSVTTATITKPIINKVLSRIGLSIGGSYVLLAASIGEWVLEGILRLMRSQGCKEFKIKYEYTFEFLYGDPTTIPKWRVTDVSYTPIY